MRTEIITSNVYTFAELSIEDLNQYRRELSREIYKSLEQAYEYANSDEHIIEIINCNDYEFTENGEMI